MRLTNAGAGAGKTSRLAVEIQERYEHRLNCEKHIFVVAYSNYAASVITKHLELIYGRIPHEIHLSTIHSFFWNDIIEPYYYLIFGNQFFSISNQALGESTKYRASKLRELRDSGILHVAEFSRITKQVLVGGSGSKKVEKIMRAKILSRLDSFIDSIFVDEAQDMDKNTAECFTAIDEAGINCYFVGDVNQDLHSRKGFAMLLESFPENVHEVDENHRCPLRHIEISNQYSVHNQKPDKSNAGVLEYALEPEVVVQDILNRYPGSMNFINKSIRGFQVHNKDKSGFGQLEYTLRKYHRSTAGFEDINLTVSKKWAFDKAQEVIHSLNVLNLEPNTITNQLMSSLSLGYNKRAYVELINGVQSVKDPAGKFSRTKYSVKSIESVKGSESENCVFVMSTDLFAYLLKEKKDQNAMMNSLYVGLTRATDRLVLLFTNEVVKKYNVSIIRSLMVDLEVDPI